METQQKMAINYEKSFSKKYLIRVLSDLLSISIYWVVLLTVFLFVFIYDGSRNILVFVPPILVSLITLGASLYYQVFYIKTIRINDKKFFLRYYKFSKEISVELTLDYIVTSMLEDNSSKYGKSYLRITIGNNSKIDQYPRLDWSIKELSEINNVTNDK